MGTLVGVGIEIGVLWVAIVIFTNSTNADHSYNEATIVAFGVLIAGMIAHLVLGVWGALVAKILVAYWLVGWVCGVDRNTTIKICVCYLVIAFSIGLLMGFLTQSRAAAPRAATTAGSALHDAI